MFDIQYARWLNVSFLKKIFYFFIFREKGREEEGEGEKYQCAVALCVPCTGNLACNPGMYPDWESNQGPFGLQASTQSTEPQKPGLNVSFFLNYILLIMLLQLSQFFPLCSPPPSSPPVPQASPYHCSLPCVMPRFFGYSISYTVLYIPMAIL